MEQIPAWQRTLIKLVPTGAGIWATIAFLGNHEWIGAAISSLASAGWLLVTSFVESYWEGLREGLQEEGKARGKKSAQFLLQKTDALSTQVKWKFSGFQGKYYQTLVDQCLKIKTEGFNIGLPSLYLEDVFVPLKVATDIPQRISGGIPAAKAAHQQSQEIWHFLASKHRCIAILASPGSGKTTLLQHLTLLYAQKRQLPKNAPKLIPVLVYLRLCPEQIIQKNPPHLAQLLTEQVKQQVAFGQLEPSPHWFYNQLKRGHCLVMLDGLDEVANAQEREEVSHWVNKQMAAYRNSKFIITSRPHGYNSELLNRVDIVLKVQPFTLGQIKKFIHKWYLQTLSAQEGRNTPAVQREANEQAENLIAALLQKPSIRQMASNPLLVTMIATIHYLGNALPGKRVELYKEICDVLLGRRITAKHITSTLNGEQNQTLLQMLAIELMRREKRGFKKVEGETIIQEQLAKYTSKLTPANWFKEVKDLSGLLVEKELGSYEFAHLSFQEYLAAVWVKESKQVALLKAQFNNSWWQETIRLYAAQSDATPLIEAALESPDVYSLGLAFDCLQEGKEVDPQTRQNIEEMLVAGLESQDRAIAQMAAKVKLSLRLNSFLEVDQDLAIDRSYITWAEYQLFVEEEFETTERFTSGNANQPITGVSFDYAFKFCGWLNTNAPSSLINSDNEQENSYYYRLPKEAEVQDYPIREHPHLGYLTSEGTQTPESSIRLVRAVMPPEYTKLANYIAAEEWATADQETKKILADTITSEDESLFIINQFWKQYSREEFIWFPFDVVSINSRGKEIQKKRSYARYFTEDLGDGITLEMVAIPGGEFMMGSRKDEKGSRDNEHPQHRVTIQPFFLGVFPITQAQWRAVANLPKVDRDLSSNPAIFTEDNLPVEQVSWYDAVEFCARLSQNTGREYRLPSEAQWEYACRAGTTTPFYCGETITGELANYCASLTYAHETKVEYRQRTTSVNNFPPNAFGLYDMHGNVWEWCADPWHDNYKGAHTDESVWETSGNNQKRILRGGSWLNIPRLCRSAFRDLNNPDHVNSFIGFRVMCATSRTL